MDKWMYGFYVQGLFYKNTGTRKNPSSLFCLDGYRALDPVLGKWVEDKWLDGLTWKSQSVLPSNQNTLWDSGPVIMWAGKNE